MPHYDGKLVGGEETIEVFFPMSRAPRVGETFMHEGRMFIRIMSVPTINREQIAAACHQYPYVSASLPDLGNVCKKTPEGFQVVRSQQHEREICRMTGRVRD